jgi:hypothetical protein
MGGKSKGAPAPVATPTPQVETPNTDIAELAARRALDAKNGAVTASTTESEEDKKKMGTVAPMQQGRPKRMKDPASTMTTTSGGMGSSAVLTG